ncbi:MAG: molybdopterin synthase large subunit MoaE [Acidimicrobiales bacterium]|nr:molybdopterin synthase large subunit MoaE [Acidimicrobiales bacterium]
MSAMSAAEHAVRPAAPTLGAPVGDTWTGLTDAPLPLAEVQEWVVVPSCGGVVTFCGTARDHAEGRPGVTLLEYEAYEEAVEPRLRLVAAEARQRFGGLGRIALLHRVGPLELTEAAVIVAVSAPHRAEAFEAARWCIDEVKATAPIWKREHWSGGVGWGRCDHDGPRPDR